MRKIQVWVSCLLFAVVVWGFGCETGVPGSLLVPTYLLRATVQGQGAITRGDDGSNASFTEDILPENTVVTLTATPAAGWRFDHWDGDAAGSTPAITVTMTADLQLTAVFIQQFTLQVAIQGEGTIAVAGSAPMAAFDEVLDAGSQPTITATAADGWVFHRWEGDATGSGPTVTLTMDGDKNVTAVFLAVSGTRAVTIAGVEFGRMSAVASVSTIRGVRRNGTFGADLDGTIVGNQIALTCTAPGFQNSYITAAIQPDGSWVGTMNGSGYLNASFVASAADFTGGADSASGVRLTLLNGLDGRMVLIEAGGLIRGTWREFGASAVDVEGTITGTQVTLAQPGGPPGAARPGGPPGRRLVGMALPR